MDSEARTSSAGCTSLLSASLPAALSYRNVTVWPPLVWVRVTVRMSPVANVTAPVAALVENSSVAPLEVATALLIMGEPWTSQEEFRLSTNTVTLLGEPVPLPVVASKKNCQVPATMVRTVSVRFQVSPLPSKTLVFTSAPAL